MSEIDSLQDEMNDKTAEQILEFAINKFGSAVALSSSFGAEDVVLIDMVSKLKPHFTRVSEKLCKFNF